MNQTYQEVAMMQRVIAISAHPYEVARQITAQQFRPEEKAPDGTIERTTAGHRND
jgi:hypothetical protein